MHTRALDDRSRAQLLIDAGLLLSGSAGVEETLQRLAELAAPALADICLLLLADGEEGGLRRVALVCPPLPAVLPLTRVPLSQATEQLPAGHPAVATLRSRTVFHREQVSDEDLQRFARDQEHLAALRLSRLRSVICVPLLGGGRALGVLLLATSDICEPARELGASEVELAGELGRRAALLLDNALLHRDEAVARGRSEAARLEAEQANQRKDELLVRVSHELRAPLASLQMWLEVLRSQVPAASTLLDAVQAIHESAQEQMRLINDLLDVQRGTAGKLHILREPVDPMAPVLAAIKMMRPQAEEKGVLLELVPGPQLRILGDDKRLQQIVTNLLSNAIKFTPSGGHIEVSLSKPDGLALIAVKDNGLGIRPAFLPSLFKPFSQDEDRAEAQHGGLGLGLAIARKLVELHGGTIEASSDGIDQGACFTVSLQLLDEGALPPGSD